MYRPRNDDVVDINVIRAWRAFGFDVIRHAPIVASGGTARSRLGERSYRILTNNCEHFCEWCLNAQAVRPDDLLGCVREALAKSQAGLIPKS